MITLIHTFSFLHERTLIQKRKESANKLDFRNVVNIKRIMPRLRKIILRYIRRRKVLSAICYRITPLIANNILLPQSYRSNFCNLSTSTSTVHVMNSLQSISKIALVPIWPHIYLMERYPHPYYHCSESYRSQLYPRPVHQPAFCLYFFFSVRHLKE